MILRVVTNSDVTQELRIKEILEIDGKDFQGIRQTDLSNLEDRIQILERLVKNLCDFCDGFVKESEIADALTPVPSVTELVERN
jgi:hypothetical protein